MAFNEQELKVIVRATIGEFQAAMRQAGNDAHRETQRIGGSFVEMAERVNVSMTGIREQLRITGEAVAAVFAVHAIAEFVEGMVEQGDQLVKMSARLNSTVEEISALQFAASKANVDIGDLGQSVRKMEQALVQAQDGGSEMARIFHVLGLSQQDLGRMVHQSGTENLLELVKTMERWEQTADRDVAAQKVFGRGFQAINELVRETSEELEHNLGKATKWTEQEAQAAKAVGDAWKDLENEWQRLKKAVFFDTGAAEGLTSVFRNLTEWVQNFVKMLKEIPAWVTGGPFTTFGGGQFGGKGAGRGWGDETAPQEGTPPKDRLPHIQTDEEIAKAKQAASELFRSIMEDERVALASNRQNAEERVRIATETTERIRALFGAQSDEFKRALTVQRAEEEKLRAEQERMALISIKGEADHRLAGVELERVAIERRRDLLIAGDQETLDALIGLEDERLQIVSQEFDQEIDKARAFGDRIRELQLEQQRQAAKDQSDVVKAELGAKKDETLFAPLTETIDSLPGHFTNAINSMVGRTTTLRDAVRSLAIGIEQEMAAAGVKMVAQWLRNHVTLADITEVYEGVITAAKAVGTLIRKALVKSEASTTVQANATAAAAEAAAAVASIPYAGPILAVANYAAVFAEVIGGLSTVASAAGGFDVDRDTFTQLHAREMVLPAPLAEGMRDLIGGGGGGGATVVMPVTVHAMDGASVERVLREHMPLFARHLERHLRIKRNAHT